MTIAGEALTVTQAAALANSALAESATAGSDSDVVTYTGPWTATANASWLHTSASGNGNGLAAFTFDANTGPTRIGTLTIAGETLTVTQAAALGAHALLEGPAAGNDSDLVDVAGAWTATANAPWLHTTASGNGAGLAAFTFDANAGAMRTGTLTIAGEALAVTQAGSGYWAANLMGLPNLTAVAADASGNVYFADSSEKQIQEWHAATKTISTLVSSGLGDPMGVAVDGAGNVYIADAGDKTIKEWNSATGTLATLVSSGLIDPLRVAVDAAGNVFIADAGDKTIKEWNAATKTLGTLVAGLLDPEAVAVDGAGNVYIADMGDGSIEEWNAASKTVGAVLTAGTDGASGLYGLTADSTEMSTTSPTTTTRGIGLVTEGGSGYEVIEWKAATQATSLLDFTSSCLNGLAVDGAGRRLLRRCRRQLDRRMERRHADDADHDRPVAVKPRRRCRGRVRQRLYRRHRPQGDQGVERRHADAQHSRLVRFESPDQRGVGRLGQRLHRRHGRQHDQGVERRHADAQHPHLLGVHSSMFSFP